MELKELCQKIDLQPEMVTQIDSFMAAYDVASLEELIEELRMPETTLAAMEKLLEKFRWAAPANIPLLTCILLAIARNHAVFAAKGIPEKVFLDTMGAIRKVCEDVHAMTGGWYYEGSGWTCRLAGMRMFRIGMLEYEPVDRDGESWISVHIPSTAVLTEENLDVSITGAREFFAKYFPERAGDRFRCHSWLLAPRLREMLPEDSGILRFQNRFAVIEEDGPPDDCVGYVFHAQPGTPVGEYAEHTSLQRAIKALMLAGGHLNCGTGYLK